MSVAAVNPPVGSQLGSLTAAGTALFLVSDDGVHGQEVWRIVSGPLDLLPRERALFPEGQGNATAPERAGCLLGGCVRR